MQSLLIANCSGFYGDRLAALSEVLNDGPAVVVTGDHRAELPFLILQCARTRDATRGYASTFLRRLDGVLARVADLPTALAS